MEKKSRLTFVLALALVVTVLAFGSTLAVADELDTQADATIEAVGAEAEDVQVSVAGMTVSIDPETGQLRAPTAEEAKALGEAMQKLFGSQLAATSYEQVTHESGAVGVDLGLSQLAFSVATVGADGKVAHECAHGPEAAKTHLHGHVTTPEEK